MTIKEDRLIFSINGIEVPYTEVEKWELKRLAASHKYLSKKAHAKFEQDFSSLKRSKDIDEMRKEVVHAKMDLGFDQMRNVMKKRYTLGNIMSIVAAALSFGKRKFSITEIFVPNSSLTPEQVMASIKKIMMEKNESHDFMNISSNPDHYVLQGLSPKVQEVLELTGGSPLPTRFFAHYYDESKLKSKKSSDYDIELPGVAKLENGTIIGGMRHQIKKENDGFRFKALVEFPGLLPNTMIKQHQMHLACEFGHWISFVLDEEEI